MSERLLVPCGDCGAHVDFDVDCPFCAASVRRRAGRASALVAGFLALGLSAPALADPPAEPAAPAPAAPAGEEATPATAEAKANAEAEAKAKAEAEAKAKAEAEAKKKAAAKKAALRPPPTLQPLYGIAMPPPE